MKDHSILVDYSMYASQGKRFANFIIDTIISYLIIMLIGVFAGILSEFFAYDGLLDWILNVGPVQDILFTLAVRLGYYIIMEGIFQRTIGKMITGTKVVQFDGSKPDFGTIGVRTLCRIIPFEQFSFLGSEARGWHDNISKTYVIDIKKYESELYRKTALDELGKQEEVA